MNRIRCSLAFAGLFVAGGRVAYPSEVKLEGAPWERHVIDDSGRGADGTKLADFNRDGWPDIVTGWEEDGTTRLYLNPGPGAAKAPWPKVIVGRTPSAEDAVFADLDGDGRLDIVSSTEGSSRRVFVQWAPPEADALEARAWQQAEFPAVTDVARWMFAEPMQIDGRNGLDLVIGGKLGPQTQRSVLGWLEAPSNGRNVAAWKWHPLTEVRWTMSINLEDMDGDGDRDILYSDRSGPTRGVYWLENRGPRQLAASEWKQHAVGATALEETMLLDTGDVDGDGARDVAVAVHVGKVDPGDPTRHSRVAWFKRLDPLGTRWRETLIAVPENTGSVKSVAIGDIDQDGRADLVVSCEHASGERVGVYWLRQGDDPAAGGWAAHDIAGAPGIKFDLVRLLDLDGDGDLDVLTNEEQENKRGLGVVWYVNPQRRR